MGRGAIPSRRGFSRGAMRHPGVSGITRPFGRLSRGRGQVLHVLLSRSPLASTRRWVPFDLHVLGAPPAFILSQDRTLRPKIWASSPSGPHNCYADRFRSIHMVLYRKRNFSGPPLGGLAKNKSKLDHFKWFDVCPDATLYIVSILAVSGSQGARRRWFPVRPGRAARRYIARPEGPAGRESGRTHFLHITKTLSNECKRRGPRFRGPLLPTCRNGSIDPRQAACGQTPQWHRAQHLPRRRQHPWQRCTA